ncbi:AAA family ATPase [Scytonema sp. UIC 10036]|uniref:GumC family protein n=1 Tax=Scytonema sp. UIC 10036 TaxID=2304196 RepID=UPI0012DA8C1E|nr:GNVR domain-containing protein [Scytonema sp. UIC 10036]MUH00470.1 AAA family ATPase [Scytonema sp. UIC 10036]
MNRVLAITGRHWKPLLFLNALLLASAVAYVHYSEKVWTATTQLILPDPTSNLDANLGTLGSLKNREPGFSDQVNPLKVQASILTSDAILEQVLATDPEKSKFDRLFKYKKLFDVTPQEKSTIILMSVNGSSPALARSRTNNLIKAYQNRLNELRQANSQARLQFSQKELDQAKYRLVQAQIELSNFRQSTGLANVEEQTKGLVNTLDTLTASYAQAQAQAEAYRNRAVSLSNRLNLTFNQAVKSVGLSENENYKYVRQKLAEVEAVLVQQRTTLTEDHPQIQNLVNQRNQLQRQLQQYIASTAANTKVDTTIASESQAGRSTLIQQLILAESEASGQKKQAELLNLQIEKLNTILKSLPANQQKLVELQRQVDVAEGVYKGLVAQVQQNNIDAFNAYPNVQVLDPPKVDSKPTSPKISLVVINTFLAAIISSLALVLLLERRNPLLSPKDLQAIRFRIVARIPRLKQTNAGWQQGKNTEIEFQRLASSISLQSINDGRLLITSAIMGEGKTTMTVGLASALVDLGFRVLVVDGDLRHAQLSRCFGFTQHSQITSQPVEIQPNLDLLATVPLAGEKIVQLVRQGRFEQMLRAAQSTKNYDYVLIDSAPVSLTSETVLMAMDTPNVMFVVRPGISHSHAVQESLEQLTQHNACLIALVVNGEETKTRPYAYRFNSSGSLLNKV